MDSRRRQWHPTPVLLPGKSHGRRSLVGCSPWGLEESDTTERLHFHFSLSCIGEGNGNPLQCSCLENPRDGGAWWAAVYGVAQSRTRLKRLSSSSSSMSIESVMPSDHLILCRSLLLPPSVFPSIRVFSNESTLRTRWTKYWSFSFNISPSNEHPGLISFKMDWLDLLVVQGTLKSLLQHHTSKEPSVLRCSAFFTVQLSHPYMTTGKAIRSDQISRSVVSDSLRSHESQQARPPCPSPTPRVYPNSCPLWRRQWHPTLVLLPGKSYEWRSLVGCSPLGR